jgi:hypothetical protein
MSSGTPLPSRPAPVPPDMSSQVIQSSQLWDEAYDRLQKWDRWTRFLAIMEKKQNAVKVTDAAAVSQILENVKQQADAAKNGRSRLLRQTCSKVIDVLHKVKDVGTAVAALNPYASLGWSLVSFLLQGAVNNRDIEQLCWDELPRIVSLITQHQTVEALYEPQKAASTAHQQFKESLVGLYTNVLKYQVEVVIYAASKMEKLKALFQASDDSVVKQSLNAIEEQQKRVRDIQVTVDRQVTDGQFKQVAAGIDEIRAAIVDLEILVRQQSVDLSNISKRVDEQYRDKVLKWLSPYLQENTHKRAEKTAAEGIGTWLMNDSRLRDWLESSLPAAFWLQGIMGSGKSCLTHHVIDHIRKNIKSAPNQRMAFFYCDNTDQLAVAEMDRVDKIMRNLLKQLAIEQDHVYNEIKQKYDEMHNSSHLTAVECVDILVGLSSQTRILYLVIDALDESPEDVQMDLTNYLQEITRRATGSVKVFISGRHRVRDYLESWTSHKIDIGGKNKEDVAHIVTKRVNEYSQHPKFRRLYYDVDHSRSTHVLDVIQRNAGGMFRWAEMALSLLHQSKTFDGMTRKLEQLPRLDTLNSVYDRIWTSALEDADETEQNVIKTLAMLALYGGSTGQPERLVSQVHLIPDFLGVFGDFWPFERVLTLQHSSVREFFLARPTSEFSEVNGHVFMSELCLSAILTIEANSDYIRYAVNSWFHHLRRLKQISDKDLDSILEEHHALKSQVEKFLGGSSPRKEFMTLFDRTLRGDLLIPIEPIAFPPSTVFYRIALGMDIRDLNIDSILVQALSLHSSIPGRYLFREAMENFLAGTLDRMRHWESPLQYAMRRQNKSAVTWLKSTGQFDESGYFLPEAKERFVVNQNLFWTTLDAKMQGSQRA